MVNGKLTLEQRLRGAASKDAASVVADYDSRIEGHYNEELTTSRVKYGENKVTSNNRNIVLKRLYHSFANIFIITLAVIDILWMVLDPDWIYFIILTTLIVVSGTMTFIQESRSASAASKLVSMVTTIITARREGVEIEADSEDIVVGDILILDTGDMIPADVRIIKSNHLKVDQSALTGESEAVTKVSEPIDNADNVLGCNNLAFMGSSVTEGSAEAVVVAVGNDTIFGSMAEKLSSKRTKTTYDKGSNAIVKVLLKLMFYMVPPVFIIMMIKGYMNNGEFLMEDFLGALTLSLTLAIGLMPEMLATIVSTNLAKGAIDMSKKKVIVKDVNSIQNFGAMDVLCSDKTGTLTQNRISVRNCSDIYGNENSLVEKLACINASNLRSATNQIDWTLQEYSEENRLTDELDKFQYVGDVPFDFVRRRATVVVKRADRTDEEEPISFKESPVKLEDGDICLMISKGVTPEILSISTEYMDKDGVIQPLDDSVKNEIMGLVEWYSQKGMRVLGVTHKYFIPSSAEFSAADESGLIFTGFLVFTDPVKPSAAQAIKNLNEYGISVKVLTGDNEYVTSYVADEIGIDASNQITGPQIDAMSDEELRRNVEEVSVFSRLTPENKSRVVLALHANDHCVGLMGDGINDVIAMKNADVSISVDTGTDIAKETASMILLEKDLGILKDGAIEGRKVYVNSVKYVKMIGSINFGYMFSLILASLIFNFEPLGGLMILIFNLVNDFACLVIPWDKVEDQFVREPRRWDAINLKNVMLRYGWMCPLTDIMSWIFIIFVIFPSIGIDTVTYDGIGYDNMKDAILNYADLSNTPYEILFASIWCIEQYWMQVWAIHIVRTNKLPFFQTWPSNILVVTTIIALAVGTILPFTGGLWQAIAMVDFEPLAIPLYTLLWMPFIACVYFFGSHLIKKRMLRTHGYFAC